MKIVGNEFLINKDHKKGQRIMPMKLEDVTLEMIERVFWLGACRGYASEKPAKKTFFPLLPGWKGFDFQYGRFVYRDTYTAFPLNDSSSGSTTIWFDQTPVWTMSYGGCYKKKAIPFLKLALLSAIEKKVFLGGRGECYFVDKNYPSFYYHNQPHTDLGFVEFSGREEILYDGGPTNQLHENLGYQWYQGMTMIDL